MSIIWNYELTCKLIEIRNTTYKDRPEASVNNSRKRWNVWFDLGQELGVKQYHTAISSKYRDLHSILMTKLKMGKRSGSGSVNWKYMKIFEKYLGNDIEQDPPGKLESGEGLPPEFIDLIDNSDEGVNMEQDNCVLFKKNKASKTVDNAGKVDEIIIDCLSKVSNATYKDNDFNKFKVDIEKRMNSIETLLKKLVERKK